jgi:spermidine/putrescine ABC transporter ATP-binding subunit
MLRPDNVLDSAQSQYGAGNAACLSIAGVSKRYGAVTALQDISLAVKPGEFLSLLGPSGCGKTTLLNLIAGHIDADSGSISIAGRPMDTIPPHAREIGMVFQNYALFPHMTVEKNVGYGLRMRGIPKERIAARVSEALTAVQLDGFAARKPRGLSGGQQQRVALARALVIDPKLLLLDEPFSALDKNLRSAMRVELKELQRRVGVTTVLVTHDQSEALSLSDRVAVMNEGVILQVGTPEEVYYRPAGRFVASFVGDVSVLGGKVEAVEGDAVTVRVGDAVLSGPRGGFPGARPGVAADVFIRPENLRLTTSEDAVAARGTVIARIFQGAHVDLIVATSSAPGGRLIMRRPVSARAVNLAPGSEVAVTIASREAAVFPPET